MATLVQTDTGKWKAVIRRSGWPVVAKTFRVKRDAQDWARHAEDEMVRGVFINRASSHAMKLSKALDRYISEVTPTKRTTTAIREKRRAKPLYEKLGNYSLVALTPDVIAGFRDERLEEGKAANTVRLELAMLSHLYTTAIREWRMGLNNNPVQLVRKPSSQQGRERRLNKGEEEKLFAKCDAHSNPMLGWMVRVALYTGMRLGEIGTMRLSQVDLEKRVIRLTLTKNGTARTVPLSKKAVEVLTLAKANPVRPEETDLVFFGELGKNKKRSYYRFEKQWSQIKKDLGMADLHFHDLRHEAISRLSESGLDVMEISAVSGHKSMQMVKRYMHLRAGNLIEKLDRAEGS